MIGEMPKFMDSPYFVEEVGNWHLKPGAPEDVQKEFDAFMKNLNMCDTTVDTIDEIE